MATKISDLTSVSSLDGSELIEVVQSGATKKASVSQVNADRVPIVQTLSMPNTGDYTLTLPDYGVYLISISNR